MASVKEAVVPNDLYEGYPAQPTTPALARAAIARYLTARGLERLVPTAALLVSELVTNAVVHAGEFITLRARDVDRVLHVGVSDASNDLPSLRDVAVDEGRGLRILTAFAAKWGVTTPNGNGKTTWFQLRH